MINLSICLSDIPKEKITTSGTNGKKYLNITIVEKRERDKYENTHTAYISQTKEEKGQDKKYIGNGREIIFNNNAPQSKEESSGNVPESSDDLPF